MTSDREGRRRMAPRTAVIGGVAAAGIAAALIFGPGLVDRDPAPAPTAAPSAIASAPVPTPSPTIATDTRSAEVRLADAFQAATGHRQPYTELVDGEQATMTPLRIVDLPFGKALLVERAAADACHACTGAIDVHYVIEEDSLTSLAKSYLRAAEGSGWGQPPEGWRIATDLTAYPAIVYESGYAAQGIVEGAISIVELTPAGPVASQVRSSYDDSGSGFGDGCTIEGRIANRERDRGFDLVVTGTARATIRYTKRGGRFVTTQQLPCGPAAE